MRDRYYCLCFRRDYGSFVGDWHVIKSSFTKRTLHKYVQDHKFSPHVHSLCIMTYRSPYESFDESNALSVDYINDIGRL